MGWATFWAIFSPTHLVTLFVSVLLLLLPLTSKPLFSLSTRD
jgi:hypothetical protein